MVWICTGEVWVRINSRSRSGLRSWFSDHQSVLRIARRMAGRKIQRFEIVVVGLDFRPQANGVAHRRKDADDLVHGPDERVLCAERAAGAGQGDVDGLIGAAARV